MVGIQSFIIWGNYKDNTKMSSFSDLENIMRYFDT